MRDAARIAPFATLKEFSMQAQTQKAAEAPSIDEAQLNALLGRAITDFGATSLAPLVLIGDRLGLYRALSTYGALTSNELAQRTGTRERYIREWLNANAASGYVEYLPQSGKYRLTPEQAMLFADEDSPAFIVGGFEIALSAGRIVDRLTEAFKSGAGIGWHEHDHGVFSGCGRFFRAGYLGNLLQAWIPSLDGMQAKLEAGIRVADIGCGHGHSTMILAKAFPKSRFVGFDYHDESVRAATERARAAGLTNVAFQVGSGADYPGTYDFVVVFDALHDMGDPAGCSRHVMSTLAPGGTWMIVEPYAGDRVEENLNPVGRAYYAASTLMCTPCSLAQEGGMALGAQAGEARMRAVVTGAGFKTFRRAMQSPVNLVYEVR
jgi:2-polyprenyl-3-methyl-5-hydroxy-6-metoxy-1,4-benzoquinol methylase